MHMYVGPKGLPLVGSLFDVVRNLSKAGDEAYFHQLLLKYGPVVKVTTMGESSVLSFYHSVALQRFFFSTGIGVYMLRPDLSIGRL